MAEWIVSSWHQYVAFVKSHPLITLLFWVVVLYYIGKNFYRLRFYNQQIKSLKMQMDHMSDRIKHINQRMEEESGQLREVFSQTDQYFSKLKKPDTPASDSE